MDRPGGEGWWLASDGKWYRPESRPAAPGVGMDGGYGQPGGLRVRYLSRGLTNTLAGFLWVTGAILAVDAILFLNYWRMWRRWMDGEVSYTATIDSSNAAFAFLTFWWLAALVVAVLMIIWFYQAYRAASSRGPIGQSWSSGWAVGGWFIPFANLVIPKLVVNEIDKMSNPAAGDPPIADRWMLSQHGAFGNLWWGLWVAGVACYNAGIAFFGGSDQTLEHGRGILILVGASALLAGAAAFGATYLTRLGRRLEPLPVGSRTTMDSGTWPEPAVPVVRHLSFGLTGTLAGFMWASAALYLGGAWAWMQFGRAWDTWFNAETFEGLDAAIDAETLATGVDSFAYLSALVGLVLVIIWFNQAYKAATSRGAVGQRWSSGWAVGGWFIPLANLVIPKLVVNEIDRMSNPDTGEPPIGERWRTMLPAAIGMGWWVLLVAGVIGSYVLVLMLGSTDPDTYRSGIRWAAPLSVVRAVGLALGAMYITRLGQRLRAPRW